ncbi:hypothetical protein FRAHR75_1060015 [Frankia sp. Hr75.2]|nr:hypothetical protein FRAHR75_1060015 [Frankia sp. Hr75.2]
MLNVYFANAGNGHFECDTGGVLRADPVIDSAVDPPSAWRLESATQRVLLLAGHPADGVAEWLTVTTETHSSIEPAAAAEPWVA